MHRKLQMVFALLAMAFVIMISYEGVLATDTDPPPDGYDEQDDHYDGLPDGDGDYHTYTDEEYDENGEQEVVFGQEDQDQEPVIVTPISLEPQIFELELELNDDYFAGLIELEIEVGYNLISGDMEVEARIASAEIEPIEEEYADDANNLFLIMAAVTFAAGAALLIVPMMLAKSGGKAKPGYIQLVGKTKLDIGEKMDIAGHGWYVVDTKDSEFVYVMSETAIDSAKYHNGQEVVVWDKSSLKEGVIRAVQAKLSVGQDMDISNAVSLLTTSQYNIFMAGAKQMKKDGLADIMKVNDKKGDPVEWWLNPDQGKDLKVSYISKDGKLEEETDINKSYRGIRPVLRIKL